MLDTSTNESTLCTSFAHKSINWSVFAVHLNIISILLGVFATVVYSPPACKSKLVSLEILA